MTLKSLEFGPDLKESSKCDVKGSRSCFSETEFLFYFLQRFGKKIFSRYMGYPRCAEDEQDLYGQVVQ